MPIRVYIAGPITNLQYEDAFKNFQTAESRLIQQGYDVVNPMKLPHNHDKQWESFMKEDIRAMLTCHRVHTLQGWENSKGALIEVNLAESLGMWVSKHKL